MEYTKPFLSFENKLTCLRSAVWLPIGTTSRGLTGFGINYFDMDDPRGYVKTAAEMSFGNSALIPTFKGMKTTWRARLS